MCLRVISLELMTFGSLANLHGTNLIRQKLERIDGDSENMSFRYRLKRKIWIEFATADDIQM